MAQKYVDLMYRKHEMERELIKKERVEVSGIGMELVETENDVELRNKEIKEIDVKTENEGEIKTIDVLINLEEDKSHMRGTLNRKLTLDSLYNLKRAVESQKKAIEEMILSSEKTLEEVNATLAYIDLEICNMEYVNK